MLPRTRARLAQLEAELDRAERRAEKWSRRLAAERAERAANWLDEQITRRVLVQVNAEHGAPDSIEGVVSLVCPDGIVLVNAVYLDAETRRVPMAGDVWLPRPKVRIVQTMPTGETEA